LSPEQRETTLDKIRTAMGLDEDALKRWRDLDAARDAEWDTGEKYMHERDEILRTTTGADQDRRLADLRNRLFGVDADLIKSEEASGFFRFDHRRVLGKE